MELADGLTARPLVMSDAHAVFEVMAAQELADVGEVVIEEADIIGDWQRPSYDLATSSIGVFDGDRLVGYAEVGGSFHGDAAVHPEYLGRGIGTALSTWMRQLAADRGLQVIGMPVPVGSPGDRLLESLGYFVRWTSWVLQLPEGKEIEAQPLPDGYSIRTPEGESELRAFHDVVEDAFLEWSEREREPYDDFEAKTLRRPGFAPWNLRMVMDDSGDPVGACYLQLADRTGFVSQLAVRKDQRGKGLARALLVDAFANAREHGATVSELSTDSRTGALGLYEKVGMVVTSRWVHRAYELS